MGRGGSNPGIHVAPVLGTPFSRRSLFLILEIYLIHFYIRDISLFPISLVYLLTPI
jgi:hypothetical protein